MSDKDLINRAIKLAFEHHQFMEKNRGTTIDARKQHYVVNTEFVVSNNRHFIASTQMESQPNGDSTTEGQSLQILGYAYLYEATGITEYLQRAKDFFEAYVKYFYQEEVPNTPRRWVCNWIINGKEPVLANWPINWEEPTQSGFKGEEWWDFVAGNFKIPHGAPYWGEYLDKVTFAFDGNLGWESVTATVYAQDEKGNTNWDKSGEKFEIEWIINYEGNKIDGKGNIIGSDFPETLKGTVQLKEKVNRSLRLCWANAQPVDKGGYLIDRNEAWHNRPLRVPLRKQHYGNASDAEEWFMDACWKLWELTKNIRYFNAFKACEFTCNEYFMIDTKDMFFRKSTQEESPFSDGISYRYSYPADIPTKISRNNEGYITIRAESESQQAIEQSAIWKHVDTHSVITTTIGGEDDNSDPLSTVISLSIGKNKKDNNLEDWYIIIPKLNKHPSTFNINIHSFIKNINPINNKPYILADLKAVTGWNNESHEITFADNVWDNRSATIIKANLKDNTSGFMIGFWLLENKRANLESIIYQSDNDFYIQVYDNDGWKWQCEVPKSNKWNKYSFNADEFKLTQYQPNQNKRNRPRKINWHQFENIVIVQNGNEELNFSYYCINDIPLTFTGMGYIIKYSINVKGNTAFTTLIGDCDIYNTLDDKLYFTPGIIPFSNIYQSQGTFNGWHGMPYPGYQYPFIFCHNEHPDAELMLNNMAKFLWESQDWYQKNFGTLGVGASAYIWNRWDNLQYGEPDTWTMYHFGKDHAWDGYQARAFFGAARACWELKKLHKTIPDKLFNYAVNWCKFLINFMQENKVNPTLFNPDGGVPSTKDFTGHMSGLWLGGACFIAALTKNNIIEGLDNYIELSFNEIENNFHIIDNKPEHIMNGSWSPALRLDTGDGIENNGIFYGFWSGEILRGLSLFILYKTNKL
ncbi:MAG: phage tail protein [Enterobacteriaceae bacterium]|jgi:hypothetical protein|nr:phage tail protein [Enterobacteriaceae bacterium]